VQIESQAQDLGRKDKEIIEEKKRDEGAIWTFRVRNADAKHFWGN